MNGEDIAKFNDHKFCKLCFNKKKFLRDVHPYKPKTSVENLTKHLTSAHNVKFKEANFKDYLARSKFNDKSKISLDLLIMCCIGDFPFNIVNNRGFNYFLNSRIDCKLPSNSTLSKNVLPKVYDCFKSELLSFIRSECEFSCITYDAWSDYGFHNEYMVFTIHFIDTKYELQHLLLDIRAISRPVQGKKIADIVKELLKGILFIV